VDYYDSYDEEEQEGMQKFYARQSHISKRSQIPAQGDYYLINKQRRNQNKNTRGRNGTA
jgi:hypothetical protein